MGRLVVGLSMSLGACVVTVVAVEGLVRWLAPQHLHRDEGFLVPDPARSFKLAPGFRGREVAAEFSVSIAINSRGLRDREIEAVKRPGVFRILVLGDSFTYGNGVAAEDTYAKQLERALSHAQVEVINAGVTGYGTFHELAFLRQEGWGYEPDLVIVEVFPNNDLSENLSPFSREVRDGFLRFKVDPESGPAWVRTAKEAVRRRLHAYRFLGDRYHLLRIRLGLEPFYASSLGVYEKRPSPDIVRAWHLTRELLADMTRMARARRVGLLVVQAPKSAEVDRDLWDQFLRFHRVDASLLDWDLPSFGLAEVCRAEGVALLDLTKLFRDSGQARAAYYPLNGHWNVRGHALVAQWIRERLERDGLIVAPDRRARRAA